MKFAFYDNILGEKEEDDEEEEVEEGGKEFAGDNKILRILSDNYPLIIMSCILLTTGTLLLTLAMCSSPSTVKAQTANQFQLPNVANSNHNNQNNNQLQTNQTTTTTTTTPSTISVQAPNKFFTASPTSFHNKQASTSMLKFDLNSPLDARSNEVLKTMKIVAYDDELKKRKSPVTVQQLTVINNQQKQNNQSSMLKKLKALKGSIKVTPVGELNSKNSTIKQHVNNKRGNLLNSSNTTSVQQQQQFGEQTADSLFRPSFLKGLLGNQKKGEKDESDSKGAASDNNNSGSSNSDDDDDDDEEEVTQTIVMPIKQQDQLAPGATSAASAAQTVIGAKQLEDFQTNPTSLYSSHASNRHMQHRLQHHPNMNGGAGGNGAGGYILPKVPGSPPRLGIPTQPSLRTSASFRLSNQEINGILNDREAPELYKEREVLGDGVAVGEEPISQQRLNSAASTIGGGHRPYTSASNQFGPFNGAYPMSYGNPLFNNRLMQSPSEDPSSNGFNHRFGSGFSSMGGYGGVEQMGGPGRLSQSAAEFNEMNYYGNAGYGGGGGGSGFGNGDFSPNSGLLRAGSGDYYGGGGGGMGNPNFDNMGGAGGFGSMGAHRLGMGASSQMGGYGDSPMLDRHASEIYGGGSEGFGSGAGYGGGFGSGGYSNMPSYTNHRLYAAGSHNPGSSSSVMNNYGAGANAGLVGARLGGAGGAAQSSYGTGAEYSSRYGYGPAVASSYNHGRGYAGQTNNMMMRGNSMLTNSMMDGAAPFRLMREASSGSYNHGGSAPISGNPRLLPLTPIVPVAEELPSVGSNYPQASNHDRKSAMNSDQQFYHHQKHHHHNQQPHHHHQAQHPQVHESLDDDPNDTSDASESSQSSAESSSGYDSPMGGNNGDGGNVISGDETTMTSVHDSYQSRASTKHMNEPIAISSSAGLIGNNNNINNNNNNNNINQHRPLLTPMIEFARIGPAGYLAPHLSNSDQSASSSSSSSSSTSTAGQPQPRQQASFRLKQKILKKASSLLQHRANISDQHQQNRQSTQTTSSSSSPSSSSSSSNYDPAKNPAHAGKYIID